MCFHNIYAVLKLWGGAPDPVITTVTKLWGGGGGGGGGWSPRSPPPPPPPHSYTYVIAFTRWGGGGGGLPSSLSELPMQVRASLLKYPGLQEHLVATELHSAATEFSPHTSPRPADVTQSPETRQLLSGYRSLVAPTKYLSSWYQMKADTAEIMLEFEFCS